MKKQNARIIAAFMAAVMAFFVAACASQTDQADPETLAQTTGQIPDQTTQPGLEQDVFRATGDWLCREKANSLSSVGAEWVVIGLARSDRLEESSAKAYLQAAGEYVKSVGAAKLHKSKCTDNVRLILALTAVGGDVTDVGGYNLLEGLAEMDYVKKQGNNGPIWALIALDSGNYEVPQVAAAGNQVSREALKDYILSVQCSDGGWGLAATSDIDVTAIALHALAPYREEEKVGAAVEKALSYLSDMQSADGGYVGYGVSTSESCAQVIVGLTALGINPETDSRFVKNGNSVVDALHSFFVPGGGFCHVKESPDRNSVATEQGYYALTAYDRFLSGKTAIFDMGDP